MSRSSEHSDKCGPDDADFLEIDLRAYVPTGRKANKWRRQDPGPSDWTLIFDCETTTDARQTLKFGTYQVRKGQELWEAGLFANSEILTDRELSVIRPLAALIDYRCITAAEFVENVLFHIGYDLRAVIVGLNLLFDISRVAIGHWAGARPNYERGIFVSIIAQPKLAEYPDQAFK